MDKKQLHEIALAYAQARLYRRQYDADKPATKDELYGFTYDYQFALEHAESEMRKYPRL